MLRCYQLSPLCFFFSHIQAKAAAPNESVLVDDLKAFVSGTVRLVHGLSKPVAGISGTRASWSGSLGGRDGLEIRSSSPSVSRSNSRPGSTSTSPKQSGVAYAHRCLLFFLLEADRYPVETRHDQLTCWDT